jgi:hypothetical protein
MGSLTAEAAGNNAPNYRPSLRRDLRPPEEKIVEPDLPAHLAVVPAKAAWRR